MKNNSFSVLWVFPKWGWLILKCLFLWFRGRWVFGLGWMVIEKGFWFRFICFELSNSNVMSWPLWSVLGECHDCEGAMKSPVGRFVKWIKKFVIVLPMLLMLSGWKVWCVLSVFSGFGVLCCRWLVLRGWEFVSRLYCCWCRLVDFRLYRLRVCLMWVVKSWRCVEFFACCWGWILGVGWCVFCICNLNGWVLLFSLCSSWCWVGVCWCCLGRLMEVCVKELVGFEWFV